MKSNRLVAMALVSMAAGMASAATQIMGSTVAPHAPSVPKTAEPSRTVGSSRNGGRRGTNMGAKRAAVKARNVKRHRRACRG
jgi:hypothetical protein